MSVSTVGSVVGPRSCAAAARLARVAQTIPWPALLGGALACVELVAVSAPDESQIWPALALCAGAAFVPDGRGGWAGVVAPFLLLSVVYWLPERWTLLAAPGDGAWAASQPPWAALPALARASRDPAARRVLR